MASAVAALVVGRHGLPVETEGHGPRACAALAVLALAIAAPEIRFLRSHGLRLDRVPYRGAFIEQHLGRGDGAFVLADGQYLDGVLHAGFRPLVNDPFFLRMLLDRGAFPTEGILGAIRQGDVRWVVLKRPIEGHLRQVGSMSQKWPKALLDPIQQHYRLEAAEEDIFIYRWQGKP